MLKTGVMPYNVRTMHQWLDESHPDIKFERRTRVISGVVYRFDV
jgi:hypothetical protein